MTGLIVGLIIAASLTLSLWILFSETNKDMNTLIRYWDSENRSEGDE